MIMTQMMGCLLSVIEICVLHCKRSWCTGFGFWLVHISTLLQYYMDPTNFGVFRMSHSFRMTSTPTSSAPLCGLSTSFMPPI
ncbi:hypothetical protein EX30DRAFT_253832 [Ascodesmis nigricans]|uniref:Uncharacterized protein n=1 Tax=Ascodesmis nigricans TaxID=341454 RepID=A0A4S2MY77_9PEZI|nr:hypothetical protein EX30DRAFT_253832 [Ascodesmis nigricans]